MLQLSISAEADAFRASFRSWLDLHRPPEGPRDASLDGFQRVGRDWQRTLASGGWVGVHWPAEFGGRGLSLVEEAIVQEELVRVRAPQLLGLFGLTMVGPVLIRHGTAAQKSRYLSKILSAEEIWCQGFSEPGAGSDLASLRTRATRDGDHFVITGHKIWTSFAHVAEWCFILCRTSDEAKKHEGLTYFLVDMKSPGITTRPLKQITGEEEFNEVFFDDVRVPAENIVGAVGDGWKIAISTLMYERVVLTFSRQLQSEVLLRDLIEATRADADAELMKALDTAVARACAVRALAYEHLLSYVGGKPPGPEGSLDKLFWSESFQDLTKLAMRCDGARAAFGEGESASAHQYLYSRGRTIAAGTSEIQRNIIAERILGLPRSR